MLAPGPKSPKHRASSASPLRGGEQACLQTFLTREQNRSSVAVFNTAIAGTQIQQRLNTLKRTKSGKAVKKGASGL